MQMDTRPVLIGFLLGLLCLIFGIFWAVYITVNHEQIHKTLSERAGAEISAKFVTGGSYDHGAMEGGVKGKGVHEHGGAVHGQSMEMGKMGAAHSGTGHDHSSDGGSPRGHAAMNGSHMDSGKTQVEDHGEMEDKMDHLLHENPLMEAAHVRLARGHVHEMGLGLLTIAVSLVLAAVKAPSFIKTVTSAAVGLGSFVYPFSWIIMGYRTTAMGLSASQESVTPIVMISMPLVLLGLFVTLLFVLVTIIKK